MWKSFLLGFILMFISTAPVRANNLRITNVSLEDRKLNTASQLCKMVVVEFDIAWDNSWRDSTNHDAVWLFVKLQESGDTYWQHAEINNNIAQTCAAGGTGLNPEGTSVGSNTDLEMYVADDNTGAFIRRKASGTGNVSSQNVRLTVGIRGDPQIHNAIAGTTAVKVKVLGIEMVYIPEGPFFAGGNSTIATAGFHDDDTANPWYISTDGLITTTTGIGTAFIYTKPTSAHPDASVSGAVFTIPEAFPLGYDAFYCMKYEVTEQQYVDFLNMINPVARPPRDITSSVSGGKASGVKYRNTIGSATTGSATTSRPDRAVNYLSWPDLAAYLDWAALRPMTEMEFEKIAAGESTHFSSATYAWGTTGPTKAAAFSTSQELGTETISTSNAQAVFGTQTFTAGTGDAVLGTCCNQGPVRSGIFATSSSTRGTAGAGYYGVMELSGNVWERVITVGDTYGIAFTGSHGDGELHSSGTGGSAAWPEALSGLAPIVAPRGTGLRGGAWDSLSARLDIADRDQALWYESGQHRGRAFGGRGVRSCSACLD